MSEKFLTVFIPCAGEGTRLKPLTDNLPKALIPVLNKPLLEHIVHRLCEQFWTSDFQIVCNVLRKHSDVFRKATKEISKRYNVPIQTFIEDTQLGSAGGLKSIIDQLRITTPILVVNGDTYHECNYQKLSWRRQYPVTMMLRDRQNRELTAFDLLSNGEIILYDCGFFFYSGSMIILPEAFIDLPESGDLYHNFIKVLNDSKRVGGITNNDGIWVDCGTMKDYFNLSMSLLERTHNNQILAEDVLIRQGTNIQECVSIGSRSVIGQNCLLRRCMVLENSQVPDNSTVCNAIFSGEKIILQESA